MKIARGTSDKLKFCQCCYENKKETEFSFHARSKRLTYFCIECYSKYSRAERKMKQLEYINRIVRTIGLLNE